MKIPMTPISTRLSGSARETELRIRNIFQWKKKRPPVVLFVLTAIAVLLCCSLVSCRVQEEPPVVDDPAVETTPSANHPVVEPSPSATEPAQENPPNETKTGEDQENAILTGMLGYDANGDGVLQTSEFPLPTGEVYHLSEPYAELYDLTAEKVICDYLKNVSAEDTMLILPRLNVYGEYESSNGDRNYVCGLNVIFYYDLGAGLAAGGPFPYTSFGGTGCTVRVTLRDGVLVDFQKTYDGGNPDSRIRELCGPLTGLANAMISGTAEPIYCAGSDEYNRYNLYMNYFFPERNAGVNQTLFFWDGKAVEFMDFTILLPESWNGKVGYERGHEWISFYHLETWNYDPSASTLFTLDWSLGALPLDYAVEDGQVLASTENAAYILRWNSDAQCPPETREDYISLNPADVQFVPSQELLENGVSRFD